jgi:hypothetical protein
LPVPVLLKRFFAPVWVFNLGIFFSFGQGFGNPAPCLEEQGLPCP